MSNTLEHIASTYRQFPDLVKVIVLDGGAAHKCFRDRKCIKTKDHPLGIPAWKMFSFHFWSGPENPLGGAWTLSPEDWPHINPHDTKVKDNFYLGYSVENTCKQIPMTPPDERPLQAYVLAKQSRYFAHEKYSWANVDWAAPPAGLEELKLVAGIRSYDSDDKKSKVPLPGGITDLGLLNKTQFYHELGRSRVLIGIGSPAASPSPYDAMCMGVPFINPVLRWDKAAPENRAKWGTQHDGLKYQMPPYVYNVKKGDKEGFWEAVKAAIDNPIERYGVHPRLEAWGSR